MDAARQYLVSAMCNALHKNLENVAKTIFNVIRSFLKSSQVFIRKKELDNWLEVMKCTVE